MTINPIPNNNGIGFLFLFKDSTRSLNKTALLFFHEGQGFSKLTFFVVHRL